MSANLRAAADITVKYQPSYQVVKQLPLYYAICCAFMNEHS